MQYYSARDAARKMGVSHDQLATMIATGFIDANHKGDQVIIRVDLVEQYIADNNIELVNPIDSEVDTEMTEQDIREIFGDDSDTVSDEDELVPVPTV